MTGFALYRWTGIKVTRRLRRGAGTRGVTVKTSAHALRTVNPAGPKETRRSMTCDAIQGSREMGSALTDSAVAMAAGASAVVHDTGMIKYRADKGCRVMADAAILAGGYMPGRLAYREKAVMTGAAIIDNTLMREGCRNKSGGLVTNAAVLSGRNMVCRFADRGIAMAGRAIIHDAGMIKLGAGKGGCIVTDLAILGGRYVRRVGLGILTDGAYAMAGVTTLGFR